MIKARRLQTPLVMVLAGLWAAAVAFGHNCNDAGVIDRIEATFTDIRASLRGVKTPPNLVTIVAIDDRVVREQGHYPLPRAMLAKLVEQIARNKPKVLALDLLLIDAGPADADAALARALGSTNAVIAAAATFDQQRQAVTSKSAEPLADLPMAAGFLMPRAEFAKQASVGVVNLNTDMSGAPRAMPMLTRSADQILMSLPLQVASAAMRDRPQIDTNRFQLAGQGVRTDVGHLLPMSYYGPRGTIHTISASDVLNGKVAAADITDRVIVIGSTVSGGGDTFSTPFDPLLPGVEIVATAITHLLAGDGLIRNSAIRWFDAGFAIALAMLCVALLAWRRIAVGIITIAALLGVWAVANTIAYAHGIWMSAALPLVAAGPPAIAFGALQIWLGRRRADRFAARSNVMKQFHPPLLRGRLLDDPDFLLQPVRQDAAVIFIDLSHFTELSEAFDAGEVRELLKCFHGKIDDVAVAHGGVITSFMGDGAMILFGLPTPADDDAASAVRCCVSLALRTREWISCLPPEVASRIGFKIGAHFGEIVATRLGGDSYQHITAIGDTVNVASRLMEVAADNRADIAISDSLLSAAGEAAKMRMTGALSGPRQVRIRGRNSSIAAWCWKSNAPRRGGAAGCTAFART